MASVWLKLIHIPKNNYLKANLILACFNCISDGCILLKIYGLCSNQYDVSIHSVDILIQLYEDVSHDMGICKGLWVS